MDQARARQDSDGAQTAAWGAGAKARSEVPNGGRPFLPGQIDRLPGDWVGQDSTCQELWHNREWKIPGSPCAPQARPCVHPPGHRMESPQGSAAVGQADEGMGSQALPCSTTRTWGQGRIWPNVAAGEGLRFGGPGSEDNLLSPPGAAPPVPCTRQSQTCSGAGQ